MVSQARRMTFEMPATVAERPADRIASLFHQHFDLVWRTVRRLGVPPEAVDDAAQEVFVVAARRLAEIELGKEKAFLYGTAIRIAADARRAHGRRPQSSDAELDVIADPAPSLDELVDQKRARAVLDDIIARMPEDARDVFVLYELEGLTMAEIATCLDVPPGTVASRLRRGRERFAAAVARLEAARKGPSHE